MIFSMDKNDSSSTILVSRIRSIAWVVIKTALLILLFVGLYYLSFGYFYKTQSLMFSGKVIDKITNRQESNYGSSLEKLLIIEDANGT